MSPSRHRHLASIVASLAGTTFAVFSAEPGDTLPVEVPPADALPDAGVLPDPSAPSTNVTVNLIARLVQKGILTQGEALELIKQAEADTAIAAARAEAAASSPGPLDPLGENEVRVTYIPEVVRNQMRDQIQQELLAQAREEQWGATPAPDWTSKYKFFGDIRGRYEQIRFGDGNENGLYFTNYQAINDGSPFDASPTNPFFEPSYNTTEDRNRARLRARFGTEILLGEGFNGGIRLATGESNSPTSPNQTLGGSGGNFSRYAIWLDRAFLSYDAGPGDGDQELTFLAGRFDNPFFSSEIQWDEDLGFDGLAVRGKVRLNDSVSTFFSAGYFPVYNTNFHFASNELNKFESTDKWLTGAQIGIDWKINKDLSAKVGLAYYDFNDIEGRLSDPFIPLSPNQSGSTDTRRTLFSQRGNTRMPLRHILADPALNGNGTTNQWQYYGLASEFRNLTLTGRLDYDAFDPIRVSLAGEVTKNIAYDRSKVAERAFNGGRPGGTIANPDDHEGGDTAAFVALTVGNPALRKFGDWQASLGYRYVESDAVVDGFTDSEFGGGGTNVKGFSLGGSFALSPSVRAGIRWMSSDEVHGAQLSTDTLQFDLNAKF